MGERWPEIIIFLGGRVLPKQVLGCPFWLWLISVLAAFGGESMPALRYILLPISGGLNPAHLQGVWGCQNIRRGFLPTQSSGTCDSNMKAVVFNPTGITLGRFKNHWSLAPPPGDSAFNWFGKHSKALGVLKLPSSPLWAELRLTVTHSTEPTESIVSVQISKNLHHLGSREKGKRPRKQAGCKVSLSVTY
jgi:hypothetical protein